MLPTRDQLPGLAVVGVAVGLSLLTSAAIGGSSLVAAVVLGVIAVNAGVDVTRLQPGFVYAARNLLRAGIVLLGFRLSFDEVRDLGLDGAAAIVVVVVTTFFGVQALARLLGLSSGLGLLVGTGFGICGASAVAAMEPLANADEEETAYAIGLVTLCGSLSILAFPAIGRLIGLDDATFGTWAGAGVHDVGQVTATASAWAEAALPTATIVKLTRVLLLAPMVAGVSLWRRRQTGGTAGHDDGRRAPLLPLFIVLFVGAIGIRATGVLGDETLAVFEAVEGALLTAGMFGLGAGVRLARLRRLGGRPLVLGIASWGLVAGIALAAAAVAA